MSMNYVKYDENFKTKDAGKFDLKHLPVFPKSEEGLVIQIINHLRFMILQYGYISVMDLYDVIETCEPTLHADKKFTDYTYGWMHYLDMYLLHTENGVTIGIKPKPKLLEYW